MTRQSATPGATRAPLDVTTGISRRKPFPRWRRWAHGPAGLALLWGAFAAPCAADTSSLNGVLKDTGLYFTAPLRWDEGDWLQFGGSLAAIAVAHEYDDNVRNHFAPASGIVLDGKDTKSTRDAAPLAAMLVGTWAFATLLDDRDGYEEGRVMLEAGALTALSTTLGKLAAGRLRPNETAKVDDWRASGDSFPSLHVSVTFAVGTVLAESGGEDYRWVRRALGYGLATATAYARLHDNAHWLSDTVAGAALGIATAEFAMNRRDAGSRRSAINVVPTDGGVMLSFAYRVR